LINPTRLQEEALTSEQRRQQRYVEDENVHAPSVITLNAVAAAHAVDEYLMGVTGLLPAEYHLRWRRFHPAAEGINQRVRNEIARRDPDCIECGGSGRLGLGSQQRLPTKN
jgi:hypothetical protein